MPRRWPVLGVCLTLALAIGAAQQPSAPSSDATPSFRSGIDIVELDVSVLGKDHMPVRGLTAADFTVLEDGKPQPIVAFDAVALPEWTQASPPWMRDVAPDVVTNRLGAERVIVMILKDVRVPLSEMQDTKRIAREI